MTDDPMSRAISEINRGRIPDYDEYLYRNQEFSFNRLILSFDPNSDVDSGFEREICQEAAQLSGRPSGRGEGRLTLPSEVVYGRRDLTVGNPSGAGSLVGTDHLGAMFVEPLRPRSIVQRLGATVLPDLQGNVSIPRQTAKASASWLPTEQGEAPDSELATDQLNLSPKEIGVTTAYSRKALIQSDPSIENLTIRDLTQGINDAVDAAAIMGNGLGGAPLGLLNQLGVGAVSIANTFPSRDEIIDLETEVAMDDGDTGTLGYLTTPAFRGGMKKSTVDAGSGRFVWEDSPKPGEGRLNGYQAFTSSLSADSNLIFGNWADLIVGLWSGVDILVNPYTGDKTRTIRVTAYQDVDIAIRHPESFAVASPTP